MRDSPYKQNISFFLTLRPVHLFNAARMFSGPVNKSNRFPSHCTEIAYGFVHGNILLATYAGFIKLRFLKLLTSPIIFMIYSAGLQTKCTRKNLTVLYCFYSEDILSLEIPGTFLFFVKTWQCLFTVRGKHIMVWNKTVVNQSRHVIRLWNVFVQIQLCWLSILHPTGSFLPQKPIW